MDQLCEFLERHYTTALLNSLQDTILISSLKHFTRVFEYRVTPIHLQQLLKKYHQHPGIIDTYHRLIEIKPDTSILRHSKMNHLVKYTIPYLNLLLTSTDKKMHLNLSFNKMMPLLKKRENHKVHTE